MSPWSLFQLSGPVVVGWIDVELNGTDEGEFADDGLFEANVRRYRGSF